MQVEIFKIWQHLNFCFPGQCCWEFEILILSFSLVYESKSNFSIYKFSVMSKQNKNSSNHWVSILILRMIYLVTCTKIHIGFILARSWQSVTKRNKDPLDFTTCPHGFLDLPMALKLGTSQKLLKTIHQQVEIARPFYKVNFSHWEILLKKFVRRNYALFRSTKRKYFWKRMSYFYKFKKTRPKIVIEHAPKSTN